VSSIIEQEGARPLGMFEFTGLGTVFLGAGLLYVFLVGPRVLRDMGAGTSLTRKYGLGKYFSEVRLDASSKLAGRTLLEAEINERYGILVLELLRGDQRLIEGIERMPLREGDHLLVEGGVEDLVRLRREQGLSLLPDIKLSDKELSAGGLTMVEGIVLPTGAMAASAGAVTLMLEPSTVKESLIAAWSKFQPCVTAGARINITVSIEAASGVPTVKRCP